MQNTRLLLNVLKVDITCGTFLTSTFHKTHFTLPNYRDFRNFSIPNYLQLAYLLCIVFFFLNGIFATLKKAEIETGSEMKCQIRPAAIIACVRQFKTRLVKRLKCHFAVRQKKSSIKLAGQKSLSGLRYSFKNAGMFV